MAISINISGIAMSVKVMKRKGCLSVRQAGHREIGGSAHERAIAAETRAEGKRPPQGQRRLLSANGGSCS